MSRTTRSFALAAALACAGCGHLEMHEVVLHAPPPRTDRDVDVYLAAQPLPRPFDEVALLQTMGYGDDADMESIVNALAKRARELGCDALAHVTFDQGYGMAHGFGVCVRYLALPAGAPSAVAPPATSGPPSAPPPPPAAPPPPPPASTP